jgi:chemotaxis protein MotB
MKFLKFTLFILLAVGSLSSCVSKKKYLDLQSSNGILEDKIKQTQDACEEEINALKKQDRLSDLSVVSRAGAENIKKSLEALDRQNKYVQDLNRSIRQKDSINLNLVMNLKRSLSDINDEDIQIEVKKGVVYISISDKLLFRSGSATLSKDAENVMAKVASVLRDHQNLDVLVEGHTDNVPISNDCLSDNWDLSVMRATAVVRNLQSSHGVNPSRMTAGGRSEYLPKDNNDSLSGRKANRRTEIIITPKLDEFFNLLAPQDGQG